MYRRHARASPDPSREGSLRGGTAFASLRGDTFGSLNLAGTDVAARVDPRSTNCRSAEAWRRRRWCSRCASPPRHGRRRGKGSPASPAGSLLGSPDSSVKSGNEYDAAMVFNVTQGGASQAPPISMDDSYNRSW